MPGIEYILIASKFSDISVVILNRENSKSLNYLQKFLEFNFCNKYLHLRRLMTVHQGGSWLHELTSGVTRV